ncbi:potassium channel family protein [Flaviaesturariibacter terrae]
MQELDLTKRVLILGHGHLAFRVLQKLRQLGYQVLHKPALTAAPDDLRAPEEKLAQLLEGIDLNELAMAYALDDSDDRNLELLIALITLCDDVPITAALFNESLRPHLEAAHPNLRILNPAQLAAPVFVQALDEQVQRKGLPVQQSRQVQPGRRRKDWLVPALGAAFLLLIVSSALFYHYYEGLAWIDAYYFVIVTVTTVGYGDINLLHADTGSKLFGITLILASTVFIWLIFSLTIDRILKERAEYKLGHRRYRYRGHIILCGVGRLGYSIAEELCRRGERFIVIEQNAAAPHVEYLRNRGIAVYIGNARSSRVLRATGAAHAKAVISVIDNDLGNLEIGLNARSLQPGLRLILRVFDDSMARVLREKLDIHLSLSTSAVADAAFVDQLTKEKS